MQKFLMALTTAAFLSTGASAQAALIMGSESFAVTGISPSGTSESLLSVSQFTGFTFMTLSGTGDFAAFPVQLMNNSPLDTTSLNTFTFGNATFGTFTATIGAQTSAFSDQIGEQRSFSFVGVFTPGTDPAFAGLTANDASLIISLTQAGGSGNAISASATLNAPPAFRDVTTPEPASIAMFGTMLVPLALGAFRRRQKAAQAAL